MLELTQEDLSTAPKGNKPGVCVWWVKIKKLKRPALVVSWEDLVLIRPRIRWPRDLAVTRLDGWKQDSFRMVYVVGLGRVCVQPGFPVLDLEGALTNGRGGLTVIHKTSLRMTRGRKTKMECLEGEDGSRVYSRVKSLDRMYVAVGSGPWSLDLRLARPTWARGRPVVLAYRDGLRAVVSVVPEEET